MKISERAEKSVIRKEGKGRNNYERDMAGYNK